MGKAAYQTKSTALSDDTSLSVTRVTGYGLQVDDTPSIEIAPSANAIATALQNTLVPRKRLLTHHTTRAHTHKLEQHGTEANGILSSRITGSGAFHSDEQTSPPIFDRRTAALDMASLTDHDLTTVPTTTTVHTPILSNDAPPMAINMAPGGATATIDAQTAQQIAQMEDMIQQLLIQQDLIQQLLAQQQQQPMPQPQPLQQEQQQPPQQPQQQYQQPANANATRTHRPNDRHRAGPFRPTRSSRRYNQCASTLTPSPTRPPTRVTLPTSR